MDKKLCPHCGKTKPAEAFDKRRDGLQAWCKECRKEVRTARAERNRANPPPVVEKVCCRCGKRKPADEFRKNFARLDGLRSECKECA